MAYIQSILIVFCALVITPWCLARRAVGAASLSATLLTAGIFAIGINACLPVALHVLPTPITTASLCTAHLVVAAVVLLINLPLRRLRPPTPSHTEKALLLLCGLFALIVVPLTPLAGIDTYKWQGLATNMSVEQCVPWLVHPLSLLGFTPRAYPSVQPLLLATVQQGPWLGVETGFYVVSVLCGVTGLCAAFHLARQLAFSDRESLLMAAMYVFSPVFMRYGHWATGRGFFLALFPAFLAALLTRPRVTSIAAVLTTGLLLPLTHKTGLVALVILPLVLLSRALLPRKSEHRIGILLFGLAACLAGMLLSPPIGAGFPLGCGPGFLVKSITRFGWYIPAALLALLFAQNWFTSPKRAMILPLLFTLPLAYPADMYGAMLALPFVVCAAANGLNTLIERVPRHAPKLTRLAMALTLAGAVTVVVHRTLNAAPRSIRTAARFLDEHDPQGPFQVHAPGRARVQVHAYVRGCPRFVIDRAAPQSDRPALLIRRPPPVSGDPATVARDWVDFLRNLFEVPEIGIDWYGHNPRQYYFRVNGVGDIPGGITMIYDQDDIQIFVEEKQAGDVNDRH